MTAVSVCAGVIGVSTQQPWAEQVKSRRRQSVSIHDVARLAGVSIASVSRVLNQGSGSVSEKTCTAVLAAVETLNYSPNHIGRALRAQTTNTYAFILSNIQNNFFAAVAWELERLLNERGRAMLLYTSNESAEVQDRCLEDIRSRQVSGVYFLCAVDSPKLREMVQRDRVILINRRIPTLDAQTSFIGIDDMAAARELFSTAVRRAEGPIAIIHGPLTSDTSARRLRGMMARAAEQGVTIRAEHLHEADLSIESGYDAATHVLAHGPVSTLFCGNDQIAYGVFRRCKEMGLAVPDDVRIYGFDDNPLNEWLAPWLNTVRVPHLAYAKAALEMMDALETGVPAREVILPYQVVMRS
jgi:LacI family transcriptional regulator